MVVGLTMEKIPLVPLPIPLMSRVTKRILGIGGFLSKVLPTMDVELIQADIELDKVEYLTIAALSGFFLGFSYISSVVNPIILQDNPNKILIFPFPFFEFPFNILVHQVLSEPDDRKKNKGYR